MSNGWIKIHRQILEWEWYDEPNTLRLFLHLLLKANHKPRNYRGVNIKEGQIMTGYDKLAKELNLSTQKIRTSISKLKSTSEITSVSTSQGTIIQIVKYKDYQVVTSKTTDEQQTDNKPITTNKNVKKEKNIDERKQSFRQSIASFNKANPNKYPKQLYVDFESYWSEHGENDIKMRFEKQTSFNINRRLATWFKNDFNDSYKPKKKKVVIDPNEYLNR
tara:strand:- start:138 stop:794 length:657 start_codon:yes stop_codon:yes gene_type:complete